MVFADTHFALDVLAVGSRGVRAGGHDRDGSLDAVGENSAQSTAQFRRRSSESVRCSHDLTFAPASRRHVCDFVALA